MCVCVCVCVSVSVSVSVCFSPSLCGKQLVVVGGALVVILPVSDACGQAFTDQSLRYVTVGRGGGGREREITLIKTNKQNGSASH